MEKANPDFDPNLFRRLYEPMSPREKFNDGVKRTFTNHHGKIALTAFAMMAIGGGLLALALTNNLPLDFSATLRIPFLATGVGVSALGLTLLMGVNIRWKHIPTYLFAIPVLALFHGNCNTPMEDRLLNQPRELRNKFTNELYARLYNNSENVVCLDLKNVTDPYHQGWIEGYMLAEKIETLVTDVMRPMLSAAKALTGDFSGKALRAGVAQVEIPEPFLSEVNGKYMGMKRWALERGKTLNVSYEELMTAHKFTDIYKAIGCNIVSRMFFGTHGCSTLVAKENDAIVAAHTLDWPSYGKGGGDLILKRYQTAEGVAVESHAIPGLSHVLAATNSFGVGVIINECGNKAVKGIPYGLTARKVVENAKSVEHALKLIEEITPASSHVLTIFDKDQAVNVQWYVKPDQKFTLRHVRDNGVFTVTTNHGIDVDEAPLDSTIAEPTTKERYVAMRDTWVLRDKTTTSPFIGAMRCLKNNVVNTMDTIAAVVYDTSKRNFAPQHVHDNYYAANHLREPALT